jgi:hypothetical protein
LRHINLREHQRTMKRLLLISLTLFLLISSSYAKPDIKVIKLSVANPTNEARTAENIVVKIRELKAIAPDFSAVSMIITTSDASTLEEDANTRSTTELPSQADDIDGDGKYDEIAFQIDLKPSQTRIVTISYGDYSTIRRMRSDYPKRAHAKFTTKYEGMGWESDLTAWRIYFDKRNAIDLFGKKSPGLYLELFGSPEYDYHQEAPEGRDIYKNGDAIGIGSVGALVGGKALKVSDVTDRKWRIISTGPIRSIFELTYTGWKVDGRTFDLSSRVTTWAGERGFEHQIIAKNSDGLNLITGLPKKPNLQQIKLETKGTVPVYTFGTWGPQVLKPGASATESLPDQNLGLALIVSNASADNLTDSDPANHAIQTPIKDGVANWYVMAAWDQEGTEAKIGKGSCVDKESKATNFTAIKSLDSFTSYVKEKSSRLSNPAKVTLLSKSVTAKSTP